MPDEQMTTTIGRVAPSEWQQFDYGPYTRFPSQGQRVFDYWLMSRYDPTAKGALNIIRLMVLQHVGDYDHPDEKIRDAVREMLSPILQPTIQALLSALWAGFAVIEETWAAEPDRWYVASVRLIHPLTLFDPTGRENGIVLDDSGEVIEFQQFAQRLDQDPVKIPRDKCLYWPMHQEAVEEIYGQSMLAPARRAWFAKVKQERFWNTFCEKAAMPTPVFRCPQGVMTTSDGRKLTWAEFYRETWEKLQPGQAIALALDPDTPFDFTTLAPTGNGDAFAKVCEYWDLQLMKAILVPNLLMEEPKFGTRAQAQTMLDMFLLTLEGLCNEMGDVIIRDLVRPLVMYNFGHVDDYGALTWKPFRTDDLEALAGIFERIVRGLSAAASSGVELTEADMTKLREKFGDVLATPEEANE